MPGAVKKYTFTDCNTTASSMILNMPSWPTFGGYTYQSAWTQYMNPPCLPEEVVKVFEYVVVNVEVEPAVIVSGPTCLAAECADEARVAAGQATASLGLPASSLKVLVRQFA